MKIKTMENIAGLIMILILIVLYYYQDAISFAHNNHSQTPFNSISGSSFTGVFVLDNGYVLFNNYPKNKEYDTKTDTSIQKFVGRDISFNQQDYTPTDLVPLESEYLMSNKNTQIRSIALYTLDQLAREFYNTFGKKIVIVSAYRSYVYQRGLQEGCSPTLCARAGHSEHQTGLAVDIFAATTAGQYLSQQDFRKYHTWLLDNAHRYGWINSYQKGYEIDGYQIEPRHWRYVGKDLATLLYQDEITFTEWYNTQSADH